MTLRWVSGLFITGAVPCELVEQTADHVALYQPAGSIWKRAAGERTGPRGRNMLPAGRSGSHDDTEWTGDGVLRVHSFGEEWSVWRWLDGNRVWSDHFYLNLEDPWRRSAIGYDSGDWELDVVGTPASWSYKDEDELEWAAETGKFDAAKIAAVHDAGRRAVAAVASRAFPLAADWTAWSPLPAAPLALTRGWERL